MFFKSEYFKWTIYITDKDTLYIELIQWQNCENGNVLATFQTTLGELLYPESKVPSLGNAEVDLLMEPMKNFPVRIIIMILALIKL